MPNKAVLDVAVAAAIIAFLVGAGVLAGYLIWGREVVAVKETHATPIQMQDGSLVLSREPDGKATVPEPERPAGHKVVRTSEVTVQVEPEMRPKVEPKRVDCVSVAPGETVCGECFSKEDFYCPPVTVRADLLEAPDGTYRVQVSTDKGEILDGVDIPVAPIYKPVSRKWAVGYEQDSDGRRGAFLQREIGRIVLGGTVTEDAISGRIGWRF